MPHGIHWTMIELQRLMQERGVDESLFRSRLGITSHQLRDYFAGRMLPTIFVIERMLSLVDHELEIVSNGIPNPAIDCFHCGERIIPLKVHGHTQCPKCTGIIETCCED